MFSIAVPKKSLIITHLIVWSGIYILYYSFNQAVCSPSLLYVFTGLITLCDVLTYYFIRMFVYPLAEKEKYGQVTIGFIVSYFLHFSYACFIYKFLFSKIGIEHPRSEYDFLDFLRRDVKWYCELFIVAYAGLLSRIGVAKTILANKREECRLNQDLNMLKNQFHSHLSFNFLNFCYLKLRKISNTASEIVEHYSNMLQYTLQANKHKKISLHAEIDYLTNFIALQKHLSDKVYCNFNYEINYHKYNIIPMLLGVLVEFAFKYGQIDNDIEPITINLRVDNNTLLFSISFIRDIKYTTKIIDDSAILQLDKYLDTNYQNNYILVTNYNSIYDSELSLNINFDGND
jgi:two-component system, LytTR family, sensor kinase